MKTLNKVMVIGGLFLCSVYARADIFFIYDGETGCQKSKLSYKSLDDYIESSQKKLGDNFKVLTAQLHVADSNAMMVPVKVKINGKEFSPIVINGTEAFRATSPSGIPAGVAANAFAVAKTIAYVRIFFFEPTMWPPKI